MIHSDKERERKKRQKQREKEGDISLTGEDKMKQR